MRFVFEITPKIKNDDDKALQDVYFEKWSYKIQWFLRDMEKELKAHDGLIVIPALDSDYGIEITGFDKEIAQEIYKRLKPVCKPE